LPYVLFALAPLLCAALLLRVAPAGERSREPHEWLATFADIGRVARSIGSLVSISIVGQMLISSSLAFLTLYLVDARGVSLADAAGIGAAFAWLAAAFAILAVLALGAVATGGARTRAMSSA